MTKLGPYELNTIVTGDARELSKAIPDESVDMVLLDPPFGIDFAYKGYDDNPETYLELLSWVIAECNRILKAGAFAFVFQAQPQLRLTWPLFPESSRLFIVAKNFVQMRPTPVQFAYDPVVFWQKEGRLIEQYHGRDWFVANTASTNFRGLNEAGWHECPRPLDACVYMVDNFCPKGGTVVDFFMGSGTTAIAAKITGHPFVGFEIRPEHTERAMQRVIKASAPLVITQYEQPEMELA